MENNVVTLETAKKLKAAGFPQETYVHWGDVEYEAWAAPTAQEIADQLPKGLKIEHIESWWVAHYPDKKPGKARTMAEALALLWLKLQEAKGSRP